MIFRAGLRARLMLTGVISLGGLIVLAAVAILSIRDQMIEDRITMVRNLTEIGRHLIQRQYDRFATGEIDEATAKRNAVETLRTLRYANDEYFFVDDYEGRSVLLPIRPELEGRDVTDMVDSTGHRFVVTQRDVARAGGGIVRYEFTKPSTGIAAEKLSHIRPFAPWGWFVATGIYLDDVDREVRRVLLQSLGVALAVAAVTGLLILAVSRSITRPLGRLTTVIRHLTERDYSVAVGDQDRSDEIGDIARAIALLKTTRRDFEDLQEEMHRREERERGEREAALAFQRDSALRLEQTSRLISMGEMATSLAHELNQPLAAVANYCRGCIRRLEAGSSDRAALLAAMNKAADQATRASRIIARLRRFLQRSEPMREPHDLAEIVEETVAIVDIHARRHGIALERAIEPGLPAVSCDRVMIEQVLFNLLRNGIEAMAESPSPRRLVVALGRGEEADRLEVAVTDFGPGIAEAERDRVFEPFYTTKSEGMGVGLAICRSIVEFHGGRLWTTTNPDGGAVFRFTLPVVAAA